MADSEWVRIVNGFGVEASTVGEACRVKGLDDGEEWVIEIQGVSGDAGECNDLMTSSTGDRQRRADCTRSIADELLGRKVIIGDIDDEREKYLEGSEGIFKGTYKPNEYRCIVSQHEQMRTGRATRALWKDSVFLADGDDSGLNIFEWEEKRRQSNNRNNKASGRVTILNQKELNITSLNTGTGEQQL